MNQYRTAVEALAGLRPVFEGRSLFHIGPDTASDLHPGAVTRIVLGTPCQDETMFQDYCNATTIDVPTIVDVNAYPTIDLSEVVG